MYVAYSFQHIFKITFKPLLTKVTFFFPHKSGVKKPPDYNVGVVLWGYYLFSIFLRFLMLNLSSYWQTVFLLLSFFWHQMIVLLQLPQSKLVKCRMKKNEQTAMLPFPNIAVCSGKSQA